MDPQFTRYIGIDYSGAETPTSPLRGLRVYSAHRSVDPEEVPPVAGRKYWSRRGIAEWLVGELKEGMPTIVGIDHGFSFPLEYFLKYRLQHDWDTFLTDFCRHWPTDEDHVYVDFVREGECGNGAARCGETTWRRRTETLSRAKSVFLFNVQGAVGKSTHAGLPWLRYIRRVASHSPHFWPFDGWEISNGRSAIVEVYPRLWNQQFPAAGRTADQQDAYAVAAWLRLADLRGNLRAALAGPRSMTDRDIGCVEGWILGVDCDDQVHPKRTTQPHGLKRATTLVEDRFFHLPGWDAIHLGLIAAAHAVANGQHDLTQLARWAVSTVEAAGYRTNVDDALTRFTGLGITQFQTLLYARNERSDWHFPDDVLLVGWLLECGGPRMDRGPARADFEANGVRLMIGGTRWRYNHERYGHGGKGLPESREYKLADCPHTRDRKFP